MVVLTLNLYNVAITEAFNVLDKVKVLIFRYSEPSSSYE